MGTCFLYGNGGGGGLNFKVVGGTTEPTNPTENTIWVNTPTAITRYVFSTTEPLSGAITESAGTVLGTINGRTYTKLNAGKAAWAMVFNGKYTGPMLVSPDRDACFYYTSGNYVSTIGPAGTVVVDGVTYYYAVGAWMAGNHTGGNSQAIVVGDDPEAAVLLARTYASAGYVSGATTESAGTVLGTIAGRTYTKRNAGKAAWAMVFNGNYTGPMLVSPDKDACVYSTSGDHVSTQYASATVVVDGVTYYYAVGAWMAGNHTGGNSQAIVVGDDPEAAVLLARTYASEVMVWISTGASSPVEFNALKKNGLYVYPISAKQYVSGAWVDKTAKIYANGAWSLFHPSAEYLIKDGVIDMTAHPATVTENSGDGSSATNGVTYDGKPALQMTGRNGLYCTHSFANVMVPAWATVFKIEAYYIPAYDGDPSINIIGASATISRGSDDRIYNKTVSIDVSSISGQTGNLRIRFQGSAYNDVCYVGNAWFE